MFLTSLVPLLTTGSKVVIHLLPDPAGVRINVLPALQGTDPDTTSAELAALQAALNMPLSFTAALDADLDRVAVEVLRTMGEANRQNVDGLAAYRAAQQAAAAAAAAAKAQVAAKAKPGGGTKPPATKPASPAAPIATDTDTDTGTDAEPAISKGAALAADLFS